MPEPQCFVFGSFRLDRRDERLWHGHEAIPLPPKTFAVLCCLVMQAGQLVTKEALLEAVWPETAVSEAVVTVAMRTLRRVLGDQARTPRFIETVHGRGYRFIAPVSILVAPDGPGMEEPWRRMPSPAFRRPPHFVGRDAALAQLEQWWTTVRQGTRQVGIIAGEAGIGKTALVATFVAQVAATEDVWVGHGQCLDHYGAGEAYLPLLEALGRLGREPKGERLVAMLRQHAPSWLVQMPGLLQPGEWEGLQRSTGGATQPRMLRELTEALDVLTTARPLLLVLEDLHWSDVSTLAWLTYVARRPDPARLLLLGTYRPVDAIARAHPIRTVVTELTRHQQGAELLLDYLSAGDVAAYCGQRLRGPWRSEALAHVLHQRTRGHPLFLVTLIDELQRQGLLHEQAAAGDISKAVGTIRSAVPESLRQIIVQPLHHVRSEDQVLLEAASLAGRTFSAAAVAAAVGQATEDVEARLAGLAQHGQFIQASGLVEWPDGTVAAEYRFLHDLYCETLSDRVPPSRQQRWHLQIGARKETGYGTQAPEIAAELAVHFERGRDPDRAIRYLQHAADNALRRSAHADAITHLTRALVLLSALPESPARAQRELVLQTTLGPALMATRGYAAPEVASAYARARELCWQTGETPQLFQALWGLWYFSLVRAELQTARELGEQILPLARRVQAPALLLVAHRVLGQTLAFLGEFATAQGHLERGLTLYDPEQHGAFTALYGQDQGVICRSWAALTLWSLGYPEQALRHSREALTLARELAHPFSLAVAMCFAGKLCQLRRDVQAAQERAVAEIALCTEQGFAHYLARGTILQGWTMAEHGQETAGLAQMRQGLAAYQATGSAVFRPYYLAFLAEAHGKVGQAGEGLTLLDEALATVHKTGERFYEAELYRLKGELLQKVAGGRSQSLPPPTQPRRGRQAALTAEECFQQALLVARHQQAKSLELRAAISLSWLWQHQGKRAAAYDLLAPVYGWFTEGFDSADIQEAKVLIEALL
ncbi:MAG TPA: AAA family ATPase [Candidatus Tectomicrobia bacterium]|jgi:predicted ATPase/DNA-binding winged helix-turn-helix (wHTH) protein